MKRTTYQVPELRDENDNIIQQGAFGKNTALANSTNDGWIDYVANDLEALHDNITGSRMYVANKDALPATGDLSAMYIAEDTGKWYLWDGTKYIETDNARKIADEAIAARDAAANSATAAANSAREQQADWNVTDTTAKSYIKNKPSIKLSGLQNVSASLVINPTVGLYNEDLRLNQSAVGWASIYLGSSLNTMSGPEEHAWGIFRDPSYGLGIWPNDSSNKGKKGLYLPLNGRATLNGKTIILDGDTVGKATADAAGNNIQTTYAKKSDLASSLSTKALTVTGETTVPTANEGNSSKAIANTEYVQGELTNYLPLSGGTMTGQLVINRNNSACGGGIKLTGAGQNFAISIQNTNVTKGTAPSYSQNWGIDFYGKDQDNYNKRIGILETILETNNRSSVYMRAYNCTSNTNTKTASIGVIVDGNGNAYTSAPTPAASDNSTKIATTEFVRTIVPAGVVLAYAKGAVPTGWLLCDGSAVSRTDYAALYAVIGTTYGAGNGSTTFNLPNLVDKFVEGSATAGTVKSAGLPNITGRISTGGEYGFDAIWNVDNRGAFNTSTASQNGWEATTTQNSVASKSSQALFDASLSNPIYGNSATVQPPSVTMRYIIKY